MLHYIIDDSTLGRCPEGWIDGGASCYLVMSRPEDEVMYEDAARSCVTRGGHLARLEEHGEMATVTKIIESLTRVITQVSIVMRTAPP